MSGVMEKETRENRKSHRVFGFFWKMYMIYIDQSKNWKKQIYSDIVYQCACIHLNMVWYNMYMFMHVIVWGCETNTFYVYGNRDLPIKIVTCRVLCFKTYPHGGRSFLVGPSSTFQYVLFFCFFDHGGSYWVTESEYCWCLALWRPLRQLGQTVGLGSRIPNAAARWVAVGSSLCDGAQVRPERGQDRLPQTPTAGFGKGFFCQTKLWAKWQSFVR